MILLGQWNAWSHTRMDVVAQVVFPTQSKALEEVQVVLWEFANGRDAITGKRCAAPVDEEALGLNVAPLLLVGDG